MSKVFTDQIEKRTGGTAIDLPATGKWPQGNIADDAVGTTQLSATGTASATTYLRGDNAWSSIDTGTSWQAVQTASFTAVAGNGYPINTTSAALTMTLPASASVGDTIEIVDYAGTFASNTVTVDPQTLKIIGSNDDKQLRITRMGARIVYIDATQGWEVIASRTADTIQIPFTTTGGTVSTYGIYKVHTFTSSGNFTVAGTAGTGDIVVIAGGAGGASQHGGGGGAGGFQVFSNATLAVGTHAIIVGAGGAGGGGSGDAGGAPNDGVDGSDSSYAGAPKQSAGGGGGGAYNGRVGKAGGSGGGGGPQSAAAGAGNTPSTSPAQGYAGGAASTYQSGGGGGGGGAAAVGETANSGPSAGQAGNGGAGILNTIYDGTSKYWAGGGGGGSAVGQAGAGGIGGGGGGGGNPSGSGGGSALNDGGDGQQSSQPAAAGANTGSGGGASSSYEYYAGNGGSGIVIIRYVL